MAARVAPGGPDRRSAPGQDRALAAHGRGWSAGRLRDDRPISDRQSALALARAAADDRRGDDHRSRGPRADPAPVRRPAAADHARAHPLRRGAVRYRSGRAGRGADPQGLDRGRLLAARGAALSAEVSAAAEPRRSHRAPGQSVVGLSPQLGKADAPAGAGRLPSAGRGPDAPATAPGRCRQGDRGGARRAAQRSRPDVRPDALAPAEAARPGRARGAARSA